MCETGLIIIISQGKTISKTLSSAQESESLPNSISHLLVRWVSPYSTAICRLSISSAGIWPQFTLIFFGRYEDAKSTVGWK